MRRRPVLNLSRPLPLLLLSHHIFNHTVKKAVRQLLLYDTHRSHSLTLSLSLSLSLSISHT